MAIVAANPRLGVVAAALGEDARAAAALARQMGFGGIQFDLVGAGLNLGELSQTGRRDFLAHIGRQDVRLVGLRCGTFRDLDRSVSHWDSALKTAADLRSPLVCVELPALPKEPAEIDGALLELGRRADRYGVVVALRSELSSFAAIKRAMTAAACPWFGVDFDPAAALRDDWSLNQIFLEIGSLIRHVRGRDALLADDRRTRPVVIGSGSVDWGKLRQLLDGAGYSGWITVDPMELMDRRAGAEEGKKKLMVDSW